MAEYSESRWRNFAAPIISKVIEQYPEHNADQEKALREAYPFGPRKHHPYKIWLDEIKKQRGGRRVILLEDGKKLVFGSRSDPFGDAK